MSYQLLSKTTPVARKQYSCIWCVEKIEQGEKHVYEVSKYDGDFQCGRWHPECIEACHQYMKSQFGEDEFEPNAHKRGSQDEY